MKFTPPLVLAALLAGLTTGGYSQNRPDSTALDAARREQAAQQAAAAANAEKLDKATDAIIAELQAAVKANAPAKAYDDLLQKISTLALTTGQRYGNAKLEAARTFTAHWQDYLFALSQDKLDVAQQTLRQLMQEAVGVPIVSRSELLARQDQLTRQMQTAEQALVEPLLQHFQETLAKANTVADIQPFMQELTVAQAAYARMHQNQGPTLQPVMAQLRSFAARWQDALNLAEMGNTANAQSSLANLFDDRSNYPEIAALIRPYRTRIAGKPREVPTQPVMIMAPGPGAASAADAPKPEAITVDNLDDLAVFLRRVSTMDNMRLVAVVEQLIRGRNALREHRRATAILNTNPTEALLSGIYADKLNAIRQKLLIQGIKADLNSDLAPLPDEIPLVYLRRIIQAALAANDWPAAREALDLQRQIPGAASPDELNLYAALDLMLAAEKSEAIGQYPMAQSLYQSALSNPSRLLPLQEIQTRLSRVKAKIPKPQAPAPVEKKEEKPPSLLGDNSNNALLFLGLIVGILGTLGVTHFRNR